MTKILNIKQIESIKNNYQNIPRPISKKSTEESIQGFRRSERDYERNHQERIQHIDITRMRSLFVYCTNPIMQKYLKQISIEI